MVNYYHSAYGVKSIFLKTLLICNKFGDSIGFHARHQKNESEIVYDKCNSSSHVEAAISCMGITDETLIKGCAKRLVGKVKEKDPVSWLQDHPFSTYVTFGLSTSGSFDFAILGRGHSFSAYTKFSEKLTFLTPDTPDFLPLSCLRMPKVSSPERDPLALSLSSALTFYNQTKDKNFDKLQCYLS